MFALARLIGIGVVVFTLSGAALAQELRSQFERPPQPVTTAPVVTATASAKRVRFVSPGSVVQLRLEVFNESGQKLFDTELRGGNVLDWYFQDGAGEPLPAGSYACVLTIKSLSGRLSQRVGRVTVDSKQALFEVADSSKLSLTQQQTIGPVEGGGAFTVLQDSGAEAITAVTHDGVDGQVGRTRGALSFRSGDLFAGKDTEQMRLTESGNLGIGTAEPQAKLDVAGDIRSSGRIRASGVEFPDGTVQVTGTSGRLNEKGEMEINPASSGTLNKIAKWVDNSDTLGNSTITEVNGLVGINTNTPSGMLHLGGAVNADLFAGMGPDVANGPAFNFGYSGTTFGRSSGFFNVRPDANAVAPNPSLRFMTANAERMIVTNAGSVGIGTNNPSSGNRLHVNGGNLLITPGNGYEMALHTPNGETGLSLIKPATSRADIRFDGSRLSLLAGTGTTPPCCGIVLNTAGNVGIGTPPSNARLDVLASTGVGVYGRSFGGVGVQGFSGFSDTGIGVLGHSTGSGTGVRAFSEVGILVEGYNNSGNRQFHIANNGTYVGGSDFAESLPARGDKSLYEPGDVLVMSSTATGTVEKSRRPYDGRVAGVYSTRPGMLGAEKDGEIRVDPNDVPVAIVGIVPTKVSTENGRSRGGDLLTTSRMPGYAMRCSNGARCVGAVVGKALQPLAHGRSVIKVLVMLR